ncbi:cation diffusion facilitator family transporter [Salinibacterium sp. NK8237]|uniref:cation diffusion facilitator family transporter n=1 Tax=Salinibacterium sp. NK8237 TaxID=2792038 RepID=UPI0018CD49A4|nr:cation diffusion facilitator family transporter [Salinibacterium sp. NK8237]MBH0130885.1 cation transporter [Salinibacterium sp. NK8237]
MGAGHDHGAGTSNRTRLLIAFIITVGVVIAQAIGAIVTGSLALLVDTAHMLTDSAGLLMALLAAGLMQRPATSKHSWGLKRTEVLSAMAQSSLLFAVGIYALVEGVRRLFDPPEIQPTGLLIFGIIGLLANLAAMVVLTGGRNSNLNMKAAFLEVVNDALGSVGVIISAIVIALFGWYQADAVVGILIALLIVPRTIILLKASLGVLLESTPKGIDPEAVRAHIMAMEHVTAVHDLHITRISSDLPVLTAHVIVGDACFRDGHAAEMLPALQKCVAEHFELSIEHSTFQIEPESNIDEEHVHHH